MQERGFKGVWIPKEIWLNKDLKLQEKIMLVEIDSLDNEKGCFASNKHFADFMDVSVSRVSALISGLCEKGYVSSTLIYGNEGKNVEKRVLRVNRSHPDIGYSENGIGVFRKQEGGIQETEGGIQEMRRGYSGNAKGSNTINNTINNTIIKERDKATPDDAYFKVINHIRDNRLMLISDVHTGMIINLVDTYLDAELIIEAFNRSAGKGNIIGYASSILRNWKSDSILNIKHLEEVEANNRKAAKSYGKQKSVSRGERKSGYEAELGF